MKRISMAGSDVAVTDDRIARLVLEYAKHLGRGGTTDIVTLPVAENGRAGESSLLLGPASEIAVTSNTDGALEHVALPGVEELLADLEQRIRALTGRIPIATSEEEPADLRTAFPDFDEHV